MCIGSKFLGLVKEDYAAYRRTTTKKNCLLNLLEIYMNKYKFEEFQYPTINFNF